MNLPNALTLSRIFIVPLLVVVLLTPVSENWLGVPSYLLGVSIFVIAALTDYFDGKIARSRQQVSKLGKLLDDMPNVYTEFGAVIAELGRQPIAANAFFTKYQDRILFGKDSWEPEEYTTYFRVLETKDEYFPYHKKYHAFWRMYGMGVRDEILKKVYYKNALHLLPSVDKSLFPAD